VAECGGVELEEDMLALLKGWKESRTVTMWYSSMKPGLWPANRQSMDSTKATMAQARGNRADRRMSVAD
jgi:hypothetical protein